MKKKLYTLLALVLALLMLTSCATSAAVEIRENIVPLAAEPEDDAAAAEAAAAAAAAEKAAAEKAAAEKAAAEKAAAEKAAAEKAAAEKAAAEKAAAEEAAAQKAAEEAAAQRAAEEAAAQQAAAEAAQQQVMAVAAPASEPVADMGEEEASDMALAPAAPASEPAEAPAEPTEQPAEDEAEQDDMAVIAGVDEGEPLTEATAEPTEEPEPTEASEQENVTYVELDCNGGTFQGFSKHSFDVVDGKLVKGLNWYKPERDGYDFLGWYDTKYEAGAEIPEGKEPYTDEDDIGPEVGTLYAAWAESVLPTKDPSVTPGPDNYDSGVWLHCYSGSFPGDHAKDPSVWVDFADAEARTLPDMEAYEPSYAGYIFKGWYENNYDTAVPESAKAYTAGSEVPQGVQVLYACWELDKEAEQPTRVTFYLCWNGWNNKTGALQCTRTAEKGGSVKLDKDNQLVMGLNVPSDMSYSEVDKKPMAEWRTYWADNSFDGWYFDGWYTKAVGGQLVDENHEVQDQERFYAHWHRTDGGTSGSISADEITALVIKADKTVIDPTQAAECWNDPDWMAEEHKAGYCTINVTGTEPAGGALQKVTWMVSVDGEPWRKLSGTPAKHFMSSIKNLSIIISGSQSNTDEKTVSVKAVMGSVESNVIDIQFKHEYEAPVQVYRTNHLMSVMKCSTCSLEEIVSDELVVYLDSQGGVFPDEYHQYVGSVKITIKAGETFPDVSKYEPTREGYRFDGWYTQPDGAGIEIKEKSSVPKDTERLYAKWVPTITLDATPGSFGSGEGQNYTRTVDLVDGKLPAELSDTPVYDYTTDASGSKVEFAGWFTEKTVINQVQDTTNGEDFWTWSIETRGTQVPAGGKVPDGTTTLYAGYKLKAGAEKPKVITYYMDWNGVKDMWGHCLTVTRDYSSDSKGYELSAEDLLIRYLNWDGEYEGAKDSTFKLPTDQTGLENYWKGEKGDRTFDGYTFLGWAKSPTAVKPDVWPGEVVKNGQSIYAVWSKDGENNQTFDRTDPSRGPVESMHITGVIGNHNAGGDMTWSAHAKKGSTVQFTIATNPSRATFETLTWTVSDGKNTATVVFQSNPGAAVVNTDIPNVKITTQGRNLTIEYTGEGTPDATSLEVNVTAANKADAVKADKTPADETIKNSGSTVKALFNHNWTLTATRKAATCGQFTEEDYTCECGQKRTVRTELTHVYTGSKSIADGWIHLSEPTCTTDGKWQQKCLRCGTPREEYITIPATGHSYGPEQTEVKDGYTIVKQVCTKCGEEKEISRTAVTPAPKAPENKSGTSSKPTTPPAPTATPTPAPTATPTPKPTATPAPAPTATPAPTPTATPTPKPESKWVKSGGTLSYQKDGVVQTGLFQVDGSSYYADDSGVMQTGWIGLGSGDYYYAPSSGKLVKNVWVKSGGKWYWMEDDYKMARGGTLDVEGSDYYFASNGVMKTGWIKLDNGNYLYAKSSGVLQKNTWVKSGGKWYWMDENGVMAVSGLVDNGRYYVNGSGVMQTGWIKLEGGEYYYAKSSGILQKNTWVKSGGKWYYMEADGKMVHDGLHEVKGSKYYFADNGVMKTGWIKLEGGNYYYARSSGVLVQGEWVKSGGKWYYMKTDGLMARNETLPIGGKSCRFNDAGVWVS